MASSIFCAPYDQWSADMLLPHFQSRTNVRYFPVLDEEWANAETIAEVLCNRFTFNDETHQLPANFDWKRNPSQDREWQILLHKFYYAVGLGREYSMTGDSRYLDKWVELLSTWIDAVGLDTLSSDVMGRRVQNWVFAYYYFITQSHAPISSEFHHRLLHSLHEQVTYLCTHLTLARNHRTIELYAIFLVAVVFPEFCESKEWLTFACDLLLKNMQEDFLADGVHCELSTEYHHLVLRNYLGIFMLAQLNQIEMPAAMAGYLQKGLEFAKYVHKPDGTIPSFSDGDGRDFRELLRQGYELTGDEELLYVATQGREGCPPNQRTHVFGSSGYAIQRSGWGSDNEPFVDQRYLMFDCGPLGAGNHGHLDLLSFEMAAYNHSLIVDPGRYTYYEPPPAADEENWRAIFRSTKYHNTVVVDGKEQTRYEFHLNRFRILGPAPDYELKPPIHHADYDLLQGVASSHEYPVTHERTIIFVKGSYWVITDILRPHVAGVGEIHCYDLNFHLGDEAFGSVKSQSLVECARVDAPHLVMLHCSNTHPVAPCTVLEGYVSHSYGVKMPAPIVRFSYEGEMLVTHTILYPYRDEEPDIQSTLLRHLGSDKAGLQITIREGECISTDTLYGTGIGSPDTIFAGERHPHFQRRRQAFTSLQK